MIIDDQHYDLIIVGTGAGGGTLAYKLAATGKKILILERGSFLPKENENWSATEVFQKERYHPDQQWYDQTGDPFRPQANYWVGGNTKFYGAALLRMRERDFEEVKHQDGISTEWPLKYKDFEPYYTEAEKLYHVHGKQGDDPTEPPRSEKYPLPAVGHEARMQQICDAISQQGLHPAYLPLALKLSEGDDNQSDSDSIRCKTCDGFPCIVDAKADAEVVGISPSLTFPNVTLKTNAKVVRLHTSPSGREVKAVEAEIGGQSHFFFSDIVVLACGAINSAALLLSSANSLHPTGLANSSDLVGRNLMKQLITRVVQLSYVPNSTNFQKTICVNDFYWGEPGFDYPMGHIQNTGNIIEQIIPSEAPLLAFLTKLMSGFRLKQLTARATGWWLQTEDLPDPNNRVRVQGSKLYVDYTPNNFEAHDRLIHRWMDVLKVVDRITNKVVFPKGIYPYSTPNRVVSHQSGTCRFGEDPKTTVLDLNCRTHDVDNLYVVDSSFFPSSFAVSPALTIIANALRVGEHLIERLNKS